VGYKVICETVGDGTQFGVGDRNRHCCSHFRLLLRNAGLTISVCKRFVFREEFFECLSQR
jgi:hypothetical protein